MLFVSKEKHFYDKKIEISKQWSVYRTALCALLYFKPFDLSNFCAEHFFFSFAHDTFADHIMTTFLVRCTQIKFHCEHFHVLKRHTERHAEALVTQCHHWLRKKEKRKSKSLELQERGTALKNKGDRWQYIKFYANEKKNQLIKIDYSCFVNVFLN